MSRKDNIIKIRKLLKTNNFSIGSWLQIPHSSIAEILGHSGYDWVAVDLEHGSIGIHQLPDLFRALELGGTLPLARLAKGSSKDCQQVLDAGAGGVIIPMVESAEDLALIRDACRWPPAGKRGVGFSRANLFGKNFESYSKEAQEPFLVAMVESTLAVDNLEEILMVKGLDAILIGPYDLSASIGVVRQFDNPKFKRVMSKIRSLCSAANIPCGVHVVSPSQEELQQKINDGDRFLAYSVDSVFLSYFSKRPNVQLKSD
jgi:2-dehydro-3-deoxyglucarate aldolase